MKLITLVIIIGVFTVTSSIRVPTSWTKKQNFHEVHLSNNNKFRTTVRPRSEIAFQSRPHVVQMQKHNKINSGRKYQQDVRHRNLKKPQEKKDFKASATFDDWKPIFPLHLLQNQQTFFKQPNIKKSILYKNYRDDETHEPSQTEIIHHKQIHKEKPLSSQEIPPDVPTRPLYPGVGQWAKKGIKHKPFIRTQKQIQPETDDEEIPEGYETFDKNKQLFEKQKNRFRENINTFPQNHKLGYYKTPEIEDEPEETDETEEEEEEPEFIPTRIYSQVRRTENEEHAPRLIEDPRLREVIKDSKIQTVYTEEGYEDIAYDHAGHEKTAEEDEGYSEFDKEIEKEKERRAGKLNDDSEPASSQHQSIKKPSRIKQDKLIKTKEIKTMSLKNNDELEVSTETKVLQTPQNDTKTHKFVTIYPKIYRYDKISTTEQTGSAVTESAIKKRSSRRFKRFTNDFPTISIDTEFIDKINHNIPQKPYKIEKPKYPYYNDPSINPLSPLRYAEDLDNIPQKTENNFAFYNQAEKTQCPEVETDINPIPPRIIKTDQNPENNDDNSDVQELIETPRLKNLGDKIDCFKIKYFGENPLDSPFFQEKDIGKVEPIFKLINNKINDVQTNKIKKKKIYSAKFSGQKNNNPKLNDILEQDLTILEDVINQFNQSKSEITTTRSTIKLEILKPTTPETVENQTESNVISIITTPKYTIDLKPKHIYHQIELLQYLPHHNETKSENTTTDISTNDRNGKSIEEEPTTIIPTEEPAPESQPLKHRRRFRLRPRPRPILRPNPQYQIFDVNQYLPHNSFALLNKIIRSTTSLPKREITSEVHYKDEINASEQLNVFADVINNIKNSSKNPQQFTSSSHKVVTKLNLLEKNRKIPVFETDLDDVEESNSFYLSTTSTTTPPPRGTIKYSSYTTTKDNLYELAGNRAKYENLELLKINKRLTTTTEPYSSATKISTSLIEKDDYEYDDDDDDDDDETTTGVLGLMPPAPNKYTTIYTKELTKPSPKETKMNLFYVLGMKPPSAKQKVYLYSEFKSRPFVKRKINYPRRGKRSAQRPTYSEVIRNRNRPIDVEDDTEVVVEDDDDYVPHRPKNYHYDEKTGKIVYDNVKTETEASDEEYIVITDAPLPKPTRRNSATTPKFENFTGPSYIDYIKQLKSNPNYTEITDPPPTEKNEEAETTTAKPISTTPPEFLSFLTKLKSDSNYKEIPDKTTKKPTTTTNTFVEIEVEEEESQLENVKNSPGGQTLGQMLQIFDINEYLPKVKNYSPRTSIDYSKYKTIERSHLPPRHNMSSKYTSDEENIKTSRTTEKPNTEIADNAELNPVMSESKVEEVEPNTTTTQLPSTTTTIRRRTRPKSRGTRKPIITSTTTSSITSTESIVHPSAKRVYPRRRPSRIKVNRTTTPVPDSEIEESTSGKIIRRRFQKDIQSSQQNKTKEEIPKNSSRSKDVEVFNKYDQTKRHGGSYKKLETQETKEDVKRLTDIVPKPSAFFTDPKLPKTINQLVEDKIDLSGIEEVGESNEKDGEEEFDYEGQEEKTTKKAVFVKDPDKRLYYYAPV